MIASGTDRIVKEILLRAPQSRVWKALTDARDFGAWFGMELEGAFVPGRSVRGRTTGKACAHNLDLELLVERIEAEHLFSYRWHPYAVDLELDYSQEPMTLVEFYLEPAPEGTRLRVTESGFDALPGHRRDLAFRMNDGGWTHQLANIARHVEA